MESLVIVLVVIIMFIMWPQVCGYIHDSLCPCQCSMAKIDSYMRRPLERFAATSPGKPYCCRFKFSPHQYPIIPVPSDLFNTWYRLV